MSKQFEVAENKNYTLTSPSQDDNFNEWVGQLKWALRKIKKEYFDETSEFIDYLIVSYDVFPVFTSIYKVDAPEPIKKETYLGGRFLPDDNHYFVKIWVSLELDPGTIALGVENKIKVDNDAKRLDNIATGVVSVIHIV